MTEIHIGEVNITHLHVGPDVAEALAGTITGHAVQTVPVTPETSPDSGFGDEVIDESADTEDPSEMPEDPLVAIARADNLYDQARAEGYQERDKAERIAATTRLNHLRNLVKHVDRGRMLEGFQTNHQDRPDAPGRVDEIQNDEMEMAEESLQRACAHCAVSACVMRGDLDTWLDFHPYKNGPAGRRRPGSLLPPKVTESRATLLTAIAVNKTAHCDPRVRASEAKSRAKAA